MSKKANSPFTCGCGEVFHALHYVSVNVTLEPKLKAEVFLSDFNTVKCPSCDLLMYANLPFIYHDMTHGFWLWVYPEQAREDRDKIMEVIKAQMDSLSPQMLEKVTGMVSTEAPELLFGRTELKLFIDEVEGRVVDKINNVN